MLSVITLNVVAPSCLCLTWKVENSTKQALKIIFHVKKLGRKGLIALDRSFFKVKA